MWAIKIKVREKWNLFNKRTVKYKVKLYSYSHNYYEEKGRFYFTASGIIEGEQKQRKRFFSDLNKDKKITYLEQDNDFFICIYSETKKSARIQVKVAYNPRLIFLKPVIIDEEGWEEWEVASTERKDLEDFVNAAETFPNLEYNLFYLKQQKINNLMIYSILPKLTEKQKKALILAVRNNYYGYPRKIKLEELAKMMKISLSTYQFHLAKAEAKLLPFVAKRISE